MDVEGANVLPCPRGFRIGATLDASMKFDQFYVDKLGLFAGIDFFSFFSSVFHFFTRHFELAYFTPLNCAGQIFPVNFNYQRCLENSNLIKFLVEKLGNFVVTDFLKFFHF